ncbi:phosphatase activator protein [Apiospora aurea]|uniref:Phosphatase activator protein n=1 Tax=Apiospora aurea TaxID=335848 RepID=A0ABR1PZR0_9PEZI
MGSNTTRWAWPPIIALLQAAVLLAIFSAARPAAAWTIPSYVELGWPQPQREDYLRKAGVAQTGYTNSLGSCLNYPVPSNITRIPFPVRGGRLQFDMVNSTGEFSDHYMSVFFYLGHLWADGGFRKKHNFERFRMQNFRTGPNCTEPIDMVERVMYEDERNVTSEAEILGLNVTFALLFDDITGRYSQYESVHQLGLQLHGGWCLWSVQRGQFDRGQVGWGTIVGDGGISGIQHSFVGIEYHQSSFTTASLDESSSPAAKLSDLQEHNNGQAVSTGIIAVHPPAGHRDSANRQELEDADDIQDLDPNRGRSPPPRYPYPASEASGSTSLSIPHTRPAPPPFFDLYEYASAEDLADDHFESLPPTEKSPAPSTAHPASAAAPAYAPRATSSSEPPHALASAAQASTAYQDVVAETKRSLPQDNKAESSGQKRDDPNEPPPAYTEGYSPLLSFTYLMAAAGGASSIITQVQQGGPPINTIGDVGADETITMDLRGTRFVLSRDELLTLPEFVLLSLFPNGLFPEGHMGGFAEGDAVQVDVSTQNDVPITQATAKLTPCNSPSRLVTSPINASLPRSSTTRNLLSNIDVHFTNLPSQYDPASLQYMLDFFRNVAQSIPNESSPSASPDGGAIPIDSLGVLREDLDFYAIPPRADINQAEMIEVKRAAARALLRQDGIFSGLKRSDEPGTTEAHLIEMLTAGGFNHDDRWGHRAGEPNKAVVCSLALARLRSDIRGNDMGNNAVGMAQKLLLFWRKPARRCWWEGVDLENVEGVDGTLKVWIRRVWTLEMSVIGLR